MQKQTVVIPEPSFMLGNLEKTEPNTAQQAGEIGSEASNSLNDLPFYQKNQSRRGLSREHHARKEMNKDFVESSMNLMYRVHSGAQNSRFTNKSLLDNYVSPAEDQRLEDSLTDKHPTLNQDYTKSSKHFSRPKLFEVLVSENIIFKKQRKSMVNTKGVAYLKSFVRDKNNFTSFNSKKDAVQQDNKISNVSRNTAEPLRKIKVKSGLNPTNKQLTSVSHFRGSMEQKELKNRDTIETYAHTTIQDNPTSAHQNSQALSKSFQNFSQVQGGLYGEMVQNHARSYGVRSQHKVKRNKRVQDPVLNHIPFKYQSVENKDALYNGMQISQKQTLTDQSPSIVSDDTQTNPHDKKKSSKVLIITSKDVNGIRSMYAQEKKTILPKAFQSKQKKQKEMRNEEDYRNTGYTNEEVQQRVKLMDFISKYKSSEYHQITTEPDQKYNLLEFQNTEIKEKLSPSEKRRSQCIRFPAGKNKSRAGPQSSLMAIRRLDALRESQTIETQDQSKKRSSISQSMLFRSDFHSFQQVHEKKTVSSKKKESIFKARDFKVQSKDKNSITSTLNINVPSGFIKHAKKSPQVAKALKNLIPRVIGLESDKIQISGPNNIDIEYLDMQEEMVTQTVVKENKKEIDAGKHIWTEERNEENHILTFLKSKSGTHSKNTFTSHSIKSSDRRHYPMLPAQRILHNSSGSKSSSNSIQRDKNLSQSRKREVVQPSHIFQNNMVNKRLQQQVQSSISKSIGEKSSAGLPKAKKKNFIASRSSFEPRKMRNQVLQGLKDSVNLSAERVMSNNFEMQKLETLDMQKKVKAMIPNIQFKKLESRKNKQIGDGNDYLPSKGVINIKNVNERVDDRVKLFQSRQQTEIQSKNQINLDPSPRQDRYADNISNNRPIEDYTSTDIQNAIASSLQGRLEQLGMSQRLNSEQIQSSKAFHNDVKHQNIKLQRDIKVMQEICKNLLCNQNELIINCDPGVVYKMHVLPKLTESLCRLKIENMSTPLRLMIDCSNDHQSDLTLYYSFTSSNPNETQHFKKFTSKPKVIVLAEEGPNKEKVTKIQIEGHAPRLKVFTSKFIYLSLVSETGCQVQVSFIPSKNQKLSRRNLNVMSQLKNEKQGLVKAKQNGSQSQESDKKSDVDVFQNDTFYQEMLSSKRKSTLKMQEFKRRIQSQQTQRQVQMAKCSIKDEIELTSDRWESQSKIKSCCRYNDPQMKEENQETAQMRKENLDLQDRKLKLFLSHKAQVISQIKLQMLRNNQENQIRRKISISLISLNNLRQIVSTLAANYSVAKAHRELQLQLFWTSIRFKRKIQIYFIRKQGKDFKTRMQKRAKMYLTFVAKHLQKATEERAQKMVYKLLIRNSIAKDLNMKMSDTDFQIRFIQRKFRILRVIMADRRASLKEDIINKESFKITNQLLKSGSKKNREVSIKITNLEPEKVDFICDTFIQLARFDFRVKFLEWFLKIKLKNREESSSDSECGSNSFREDHSSKKQKRIEISAAINQAIYQKQDLLDFLNKNNLTNFKTHKDKRATLRNKKARQTIEIKIEEVQTIFDKKTEERQENVDLDVQMAEQVRRRNSDKKNKNKLALRMANVREDVIVKQQKEVEKITRFAMLIMAFKVPMPKFLMYSNLDRDLLQMMLIKATEIELFDIDFLREQYGVVDMRS